MTSFTTSQAALAAIKSSGARKSAVVLYHGKYLLEKHARGLGSGVWEIREQVLIAALDDFTHEKATAEACLSALQKKFGKESVRVMRLEGMVLEAARDYDGAQKIYELILTKDPNNLPAMKRKVALLKGLGMTENAIKELNAILATHVLDVESWKELAELYLTEQMYQLAAICFEELILLAPTNHLHYLNYAMTLYTMGGHENLVNAKAYYCKVLDLNHNNTHALIGLHLVCQALPASTPKVPELLGFASARLEEKYDSPSVSAPIKKAILGVLGASPQLEQVS